MRGAAQAAAAARNRGRAVRGGAADGRWSGRASISARDATEAQVKALRARRAGAMRAIVHFATHGALAGEMQEMRARARPSPALLLTPPETPSEEDDGLSHRVRGGGAQARCGLGDPVGLQHGGWRRARAPRRCPGSRARSFYARSARAAGLALGGELGSHREAHHRRHAAACSGQGHGPRRGDAPRPCSRSSRKGGREAHPAYWAPFVVVGEGGAAK